MKQTASIPSDSNKLADVVRSLQIQEQKPNSTRSKTGNEKSSEHSGNYTKIRAQKSYKKAN